MLFWIFTLIMALFLIVGIVGYYLSYRGVEKSGAQILLIALLFQSMLSMLLVFICTQILSFPRVLSGLM